MSSYKNVNSGVEDKYECTLTADDLKYALEKLHEDSTTRSDNIKLLRQWVQDRPHLHAHDDVRSLLYFLRGCKFDQERVRRKLILYYEMRAKAPEWFNMRDPCVPNLQDLLKLGIFLPLLKRDPHTGHVLILIRAAVHNPKQVSQNDVLKVSKMVMDMAVKKNEYISIYGVRAVIDLNGVSLGHALQLTPTIISKLVHAWQECYPIRTRSMDFINCPAHINVVLNIFRRFMSDKMRNRIHVYGRDALSKLTAPEILPQEYGGSAEPLADLIEYWRKLTTSEQEWFLRDDIHKADLSKKNNGYV